MCAIVSRSADSIIFHEARDDVGGEVNEKAEGEGGDGGSPRGAEEREEEREVFPLRPSLAVGFKNPIRF